MPNLHSYAEWKGNETSSQQAMGIVLVMELAEQWNGCLLRLASWWCPCINAILTTEATMDIGSIVFRVFTLVPLFFSLWNTWQGWKYSSSMLFKWCIATLSKSVLALSNRVDQPFTIDLVHNQLVHIPAFDNSYQYKFLSQSVQETRGKKIQKIEIHVLFLFLVLQDEPG